MAPKTIVPSSDHAPFNGSATAQITTGGDASRTLIFCSLPSAKNPTQCPSAEKNGADAPSVPASGTASN